MRCVHKTGAGSIVPGTVSIDFERYPGPDGKLGTADDVPTQTGDVIIDQYVCRGVLFSLVDGTHPVLRNTGTAYLPLSPMALRPSASVGGDERTYRDIVIDFITPVSRVGLKSLDTDEPITLRVFNAAGVQIASDYQPPTGNTAVASLEARVNGALGFITRAVIDVKESNSSCCAGGPEVYDLLEFEPVGPIDDSACDEDGDGVPGGDDVCPGTPPGTAVDMTGCSSAQRLARACPLTEGYKNHGEYVRCVAHEAERQLSIGLISEAEKDAIIAAAAKARTGKK